MNTRHQTGVTLMELMIVMVIVSILASIAYPSYRQQIIRTARSEAKVALEQTAGNLERCFTRLNRYDDAANCPTTNNLAGGGFPTERGNYAITAVIPDATHFTLTATPQGTQATGDPKCANFTLNEQNVRAVSGTLSATPLECWSR